MSKISNYSDEDLGRLIRAAAKAHDAETVEKITTRQALKSFFNMIGLGFIADAIDVVQYAYERISGLLKKIFKGSWW